MTKDILLTKQGLEVKITASSYTGYCDSGVTYQVKTSIKKPGFTAFTPLSEKEAFQYITPLDLTNAKKALYEAMRPTI